MRSLRKNSHDHECRHQGIKGNLQRGGRLVEQLPCREERLLAAAAANRKNSHWGVSRGRAAHLVNELWNITNSGDRQCKFHNKACNRPKHPRDDLWFNHSGFELVCECLGSLARVMLVVKERALVPPYPRASYLCSSKNQILCQQAANALALGRPPGAYAHHSTLHERIPHQKQHCC